MIVCLLHENMMNIGKLDKRSSWDVKKILATCQDDVWTVGLRNLKAKTDLCYAKGGIKKPNYFLLTKVFFSDGGLHKPELKILKRGQFCFVAMFRIWNARIINKVVGNLLGKLSRRLQSWQVLSAHCCSHNHPLNRLLHNPHLNKKSSSEQTPSQSSSQEGPLDWPRCGESFRFLLKVAEPRYGPYYGVLDPHYIPV